MTAASPPQQTSEPSYPDIIVIAINRHGVLLIHPKTKVTAGPQQGCRSCLGPSKVVPLPPQRSYPCPSHPSHSPRDSGGPQSGSPGSAL